MFPGLAAKLGKKAIGGLVDTVADELFDKDGKKILLPSAKTPVRAIAQLVVATVDFCDATGRNELERVEAVEEVLLMALSEDEAGDPDDEEKHEKHDGEPPG